MTLHLAQPEPTPITQEEVTLSLSSASSKSAPRPSRVGYNLLKWAHEARPDALTNLFNHALSEGTHPWTKVLIVVINKLRKPDYSVPKAYRPISLMECAGKLLEKIIAKQINRDIDTHNLLSMSQFGSRP
jgi:hypothetical protein